MDGENAILEAIFLIAVVILWGILNYIFYRMCIVEDNSFFRWKKFRNLFGLIGIEMIFSVCLISFLYGFELIDVVEDLKTNWCSILIVSFLICLFLNFLGIQSAIVHLLGKRNSTNNCDVYDDSNLNDNSMEKWKKGVANVISLLIFMSIGIVFSYILASSMEYDRKGYKVIAYECEINLDDKYCFQTKESEKAIYVYPIVYETDESYFISKMYKEEGQKKIDYCFLKEIEKKNIETRYIDDIYQLEMY